MNRLGCGAYRMAGASAAFTVGAYLDQGPIRKNPWLI